MSTARLRTTSTSLPLRRLKYKFLALLALIPSVFVIFFVVSHQSQLDGILRIINLLGTFIHEGGHSFAGWVTHGQIQEVVVNPDGSGFAVIAGGDLFWILPAGYMTSTLLTALMFFVNNRSRWGEVIPLLMGITIFILTIVYGARLSGGATTIIVGIVSSVVLLYFGIHPTIEIPFTKKKFSLPDWAWMFFVNLMSLYFGIGGILSLEYLSRNAQPGNPDDISRFAVSFVKLLSPQQVAWGLMAISIVVWILVITAVVYGLFVEEEEITKQLRSR